MLYPWLGNGKGKTGTGDKKGKGQGKKGESNTDVNVKDKDKKGKGKANAKATEYFAGYCLLCKAWRHLKKDCLWNESAKSGKDTTSLETPITPAANTTTEPPITGMLMQSNEGEVVAADPAHSGNENPEDFLIESGAATSVCQQSLAGKPRGPGGTRVSHWTSVHEMVSTLRASF